MAFFAAVVVVITTCVVYFNSPRIYEAKSEFTIDVRRRQGGNGTGAASSDRDSYGSAYEEIFNTRQSDWRSEGIFTKVIQQYRANYPNSQVTDKDLVEMLASSELELVRHSRLITIAVRSKSPELAAALANAPTRRRSSRSPTRRTRSGATRSTTSMPSWPSSTRASRRRRRT